MVEISISQNGSMTDKVRVLGGQAMPVGNRCLFCKIVLLSKGQKGFCSSLCYWKSKVGERHWWGYKISAKLANKPKSPEHIKNQSLSILGKKRPDVARDKNPNWKGGVTPINEIIRKSVVYYNWRKSVFERDNFTCVLCGVRGEYLNADHIKPFSLFPELRFAIDNGRTLCVPCHKKIGWKINKGVKHWGKNKSMLEIESRLSLPNV